ncbi:MAG: methylmalonyl-CoA mutase family protein [Pseudomonadota bacterium]
MSTSTRCDLCAGFPPASMEQWRHLIEKTLRGGDFEKQLVAHTADGIRIEPLYMQAADKCPVTGKTYGQPWRIGQRIDHPDPVAANRLALSDLEGGATLLSIVTSNAVCARGYGVVVQTIEDLAQLFANTALDTTEFRLEPSPNGKAQAALMAAFFAQSNVPADALRIDFGIAPITALLHESTLAEPRDTLMRDLATIGAELYGYGYTSRLIQCDVRPVHDAGGSEAQELATALAMGVEYLRGLTQNGYTLTDAARLLSWSLAVDADQFMGLAKLRALRLLWMRIEETSGLPHQPVHIHAETAWRMMSRRDPTVNILRTTLAAAAASLGGADSITVLPHTLPLGLPDTFARRLARNTQIVLSEEANLWRVADPAAGAAAYEALSDELCRVAWKIFQEIEAEGGLIASIQAGSLQARIAAAHQARMKQITHRAMPLTGVSEFPSLDQTDEQVLDVAPPAQTTPSGLRKGDRAKSFAELVRHFSDGAGIADVIPPPTAAIKATALSSVRLSAPFEALCDAADSHAIARGRRPTVFLANLGQLAAHGTRSAWVRNLLAAGGIDTTATDGSTDPAEAGCAFTASATAVACICGTDDSYAQLGATTAEALIKAGAAAIYLVGHPGPYEQALRSGGINGFLFTGIDAVAVLTEIHKKLGVRNSV